MMGPPGAGKGTHAQRLSEVFAMAHVSSGDIFRAERAGGSELGKSLARYMDAGELVPDHVVVATMAKAIASSGASGGLLLDGFPRTVAQAEALDTQLARAGTPLDAVVVLDADDDLIVERISGRRSCPKCARVYNVKFMPPAAEGICDGCGAKLTQREDDTAEVVRQRLAAYYSQTEPVLKYYRNLNGLRVIDIDGSGEADEVTAALMVALEALGLPRVQGCDCGGKA